MVGFVPLPTLRLLVHMKVKLTKSNQVNSCYFRTSVSGGNRKALIKITERCNLKCVHCFVSSGDFGDEMRLVDIQKQIIPQLIDARVISVTLTGGEPFIHTEIKDVIRAFINAGLSVSICSNGVGLAPNIIEFLKEFKNITVNISLDGFSESTHGKFRGNKKSFNETIDSIALLNEAKLLKGLLSTPNSLSNIDEYEELIKFSIKNNAKYVLMNPLGNFGRGEKSTKKLRFPDSSMSELYNRIIKYSDQVEIVDIRFPNTNGKLLASCEAGNIIYIFTNGDVTVCPYLVFASKTKVSKYNENEFIVSNILNSSSLRKVLDGYDIHQNYSLGNNKQCNTCKSKLQCGKGCPAAIIASGQNIDGVDYDLCPINN